MAAPRRAGTRLDEGPNPVVAAYWSAPGQLSVMRLDGTTAPAPADIWTYLNQGFPLAGNQDEASRFISSQRGTDTYKAKWETLQTPVAQYSLDNPAMAAYKDANGNWMLMMLDGTVGRMPPNVDPSQIKVNVASREEASRFVEGQRSSVPVFARKYESLSTPQTPDMVQAQARHGIGPAEWDKLYQYARAEGYTGSKQDYINTHARYVASGATNIIQDLQSRLAAGGPPSRPPGGQPGAPADLSTVSTGATQTMGATQEVASDVPAKAAESFNLVQPIATELANQWLDVIKGKPWQIGSDVYNRAAGRVSQGARAASAARGMLGGGVGLREENEALTNLADQFSQRELGGMLSVLGAAPSGIAAGAQPTNQLIQQLMGTGNIAQGGLDYFLKKFFDPFTMAGLSQSQGAITGGG